MVVGMGEAVAIRVGDTMSANEVGVTEIIETGRGIMKAGITMIDGAVMEAVVQDRQEGMMTATTGRESAGVNRKTTTVIKVSGIADFNSKSRLVREYSHLRMLTVRILILAGRLLMVTMTGVINIRIDLTLLPTRTPDSLILTLPEALVHHLLLQRRNRNPMVVMDLEDMGIEEVEEVTEEEGDKKSKNSLTFSITLVLSL